MKNLRSKHKLWFYLVLAQFYLLSTFSVINAQSNQQNSQTSKLSGTEWNWQEKGKFFYVFPNDKPGVAVILAPYEFLNINGDVTTGVYTQVGTYKIDGNSVKLDFPDHYVIATIKGNIMEGEVTEKKTNTKYKWLVLKTSKDNVPNEQNNLYS